MTSGFVGRASTRGKGSRRSIPRPAATRREFVVNVPQARHDPLHHRRGLYLVSSKRNALTTCVRSWGVWLFQKSVACE